MDSARITSGVYGLDPLIDGGFLTDSSILVRGAPGTGKTTLAMQYLAEGVKKGQAGLLVSFEQFPNMLRRDMKTLGFDLEAYEATNLLSIVFTSPEVFLRSLLSSDNPIFQIIHEKNIVRVALDSITHFTQLATDNHSLRETYNTVVNGLQREGVTTLYLGEEARTDFTSEERGRLSFIMDTIIMLRYFEIDSAIQRGLLVLKMRASNHDKRIFRYTIKSSSEAVGLHIEAPIEGKIGLLNAITQKSLISNVRQASY